MAANNPGFPPQPAQPATIPPAPSPLAAGYYPFCDSYTLHRVLASDGIVLMRYFVRPRDREDIDAVFADLHAAKIPNFHIFKWRLAMALQDNTADGIVVSKIYNQWAKRGIQVTALACALKWPEAAINTITNYKDKDTRLSFPTVEEIRAVLPPELKETLFRVPGYALGERFPMFAFAPS